MPFLRVICSLLPIPEAPAAEKTGMIGTTMTIMMIIIIMTILMIMMIITTIMTTMIPSLPILIARAAQTVGATFAMAPVPIPIMAIPRTVPVMMVFAANVTAKALSTTTKSGSSRFGYGLENDKSTGISRCFLSYMASCYRYGDAAEDE
jgi:hypothetical protein